MKKTNFEGLKPKSYRETHSPYDYTKVVMEGSHSMLSYQRPQGKSNRIIDDYTVFQLKSLFKRLCRENISEELKNKYRESLVEGLNIISSELNDEQKPLFVDELSESLINYFKSIAEKEKLIPHMLEELKELLAKSNLPTERVKEPITTNNHIKLETNEEKDYTEEEIMKLMEEELKNKKYCQFNFGLSYDFYNYTKIYVGTKSRRVLYICVSVGDKHSGAVYDYDVIKNEEKMWQILENYDEEGIHYITMKNPEVIKLKEYVHHEDWEKIKSSINNGYTKRLLLR